MLHEDGDPTQLETTHAAAARVYNATGVNASDIQCAEVHDCFALTELLMYEALGFAAAGQANRLIREGHTDLGGKLPVNTGGGLIGFGHPVGATGVKQILELYKQMKGQCGDYQMASTPELGLAANMGGNDKTSVVTIVKNHG